jgi:hypothetical protein
MSFVRYPTWVLFYFAVCQIIAGAAKLTVSENAPFRTGKEADVKSTFSCLVHPYQLLSEALEKTIFEMEVEDLNSEHRIDDHLARRLIALPLTEAFNPSQASGMHNKVQYGDKCSLPASLGKVIFDKPYEVPWLFEVIPLKSNQKKKREQNLDVLQAEKTQIDKAFVSPLDFRAPENYVFFPRWLMQSLGIHSFDLVDVSFVRIKLAGLIVLSPQTLAWDEMMARHGNLKSVLEHEVNKYSALTKGATIFIEVDGVELPLLVKETKAEGGVSVKGVRIQDSDVKVDIDRAFLDDIIKAQKKIEQEKIAAEKV